MKEVTIPEKLVPLVKAFSSDDQAAKLLILEAARAISRAESKAYSLNDHEPSEEELEGIIALMQGIAPKDTIEMIYGAQIISSHLMGLRLLRQTFATDQALGLKLLRFSNEAMNQLQKKRSCGTSQNITVNYNYHGQGNALMQTVIPKDETCQ